MWFGSELSGFQASAQTTTACSRPTKGTEVTLPLSADPSSLMAIVGTTSFGQKVSSTSSVQDPSSMPASILGYLDTLPEVRSQFSDIPVTSCAYLAPRPEECTVVKTLTSTSCLSGSGNLTRTACTEKVVTVTSTIAAAASSTGLGPIFVPRRSAAYLTYNTLTPSGDAGAAALDKAPVETTSTTSRSQSKETETGFTFERVPSITAAAEAPEDSKPTSKLGETSHAAESQPAEAVISALVSLAVASQDTAKATESGDTTEGHQTGNAENQQSASDGVVEHSETQSIGNLLGALQGVASQAATSQGLAATPVPQEVHSETREVEPQTGSGSSKDASSIALSATATAASVSDTIPTVLPVFTLQGQTVTAGGAATFGGNAVSELPNQGGVVIGPDHTVDLSDGEGTTISRQSSQQPITVSRSGSAFIVNGQTLPANREITAGQATASASTTGSSAILYIDGTPVSTISTAGGSSSTSSTGVGGYINSGIGGDGASASSDGSAANATGSATTPFTGDGSRASVLGWSNGVRTMSLLSFLGVVCLL